MANDIVTRDYLGTDVVFNNDGWINATDYAAKHGKRIDNWLRLDETKEYITALCEISNTSKVRYLKTKRGNSGGTWLHPKLAVTFARWLDPRFAVWCDAQIDNLIHSKNDWRKLRSAAASSNKVMNAMLQEVRAAVGKATESHHYMCEAKLVNWAHSGQFTKLDRDSLNIVELELLAFLETKNSTLNGREVPYETRKILLKQYAMDWRMVHIANFDIEALKPIA